MEISFSSLGNLHSTTPTPSSTFPMSVTDGDLDSETTIWELYERWIVHCNLTRTLTEKRARFSAFKENAEFINSENKTDQFPYELQLNKYSDMTNKEFESNHPSVHSNFYNHLDIRDSDVDSHKSIRHLYKLWMSCYGVFRSPAEKLARFEIFKEQVKYIHSENKKGTNLYKLGLNPFSDRSTVEFERQQMGATPSEMVMMYKMIIDMGGLLSKNDYAQGRMDGPRATLDGYEVVAENDEEALEEVATKHPVCAMIDARGDAFKNYRGGVLTEEVGKETGFAVTIIGYGVTPCGVKFWEVQNWWGPKWGEGGCARLKKGVNFRGIASFATHCIPNIESSLAFLRR